jgi:hypothetical protein
LGRRASAVGADAGIADAAGFSVHSVISYGRNNPLIGLDTRNSPKVLIFAHPMRPLEGVLQPELEQPHIYAA